MCRVCQCVPVCVVADASELKKDKIGETGNITSRYIPRGSPGKMPQNPGAGDAEKAGYFALSTTDQGDSPDEGSRSPVR